MEAKALGAESSIDRARTKDEAFKSAVAAAELYMEAVKQASNDRERARLRIRCERLLSKAEDIKKTAHWAPLKAYATVLKAPVSERSLSRSEEIILLESSKLHGFIFPPWASDPEDSFERVADLYTDPVDLKLSSSQKEIFAGWRRPLDTSDSGEQKEVDGDASIMTAAQELDLVQDITTDCSVVASLCADAARTSKGHAKLLGSAIYPFDRSNAQPRVSKSGKYIFRFHFNGCFRKVTIDDRLPSSNSSRSLHVIDRNNPHLLWPALVEKAYLKVRGGYDFPGSNSGTDLWVLTGWIPEQVFLQSDDPNPEKLWSRLLKSFEFGDVMITLGTGKLSCKEEKELGLAGAHDYAVLDMKETGSQRQLLIKNPWCDGMVWKGFRVEAGEEQEQSWTRELSEALPERSPTTPGTFWMDFEDVVQHFESLYLNWNPGLFLYRQDHHFSWTMPPIKNPGSFIYNPQYAVRSDVQATVWILLSRHFATGEHDIVREKPLADASAALGFISLYIFEADGNRVYLGDDALHRGAFVDSPQTLARLDLCPSKTYTIVAAQQDLPLPKYSFTLSLFSRSPLTTSPALDPLPHQTTVSGSWTPRSAGGNAHSPAYPSNPQFRISIPSPTSLTLFLETPASDLAVHASLVWGGGRRVAAVTPRDVVGGSGEYRRGCALASIPRAEPGTYTIVCSTFAAGQTGSFTLRVGAGAPCAVEPIPAEEAGRLSARLPRIVFAEGVERMLAPLTVGRMARLRIVARAAARRPLLRVAVERGQGPNKVVLDVSGQGEFNDAPMGVRTADLDVGPESGLPGGLWIVVERVGGGAADVVDVEVLSDAPVDVGLWGTGDG